MDLTARDIHEKQFHDSWRGYNQEEVDEFLDRIADVVDRLQRENSALNARITELDHAVSTSRDTEEMLKKTLVTAQQAAEEAIASAKAKAEALIQEAEERTRRVHREADEKLQAADAEARRKGLEADREHTIRKREIDASLEKLRRFESDLKRRLTNFLKEQSRGLERLTEEEPPSYEPPKPQNAPIAGDTAIEESDDEGDDFLASAENTSDVDAEHQGEPEEGEPEEGAPDNTSDEPTSQWIPDFVATKEASPDDSEARDDSDERSARETNFSSLYGAAGELQVVADGEPADEAAIGEGSTVTLAEEEAAPARGRGRLFWRGDS